MVQDSSRNGIMFTTNGNMAIRRTIHLLQVQTENGSKFALWRIIADVVNINCVLTVLPSRRK